MTPQNPSTIQAHAAANFSGAAGVKTSGGNKWHPKLPAAAAVSAMIVYCLINASLSAATGAARQLQTKPEERGATFVACDSAVRQFERHARPSIVLMGSSVVMAPLWSVDSKKFPGVADVYHHHSALELERLLEQHGFGQQQIDSFALPGLMISDGYLLTEKLLKGGKEPRLLVYGLAPRDFMDDLLTGETRTATFQRLVEIADLPDIGDLYLSTPQEKLDFMLNNLIYLYGKRWRYQDKAAGIWKKALKHIMPEQPQTTRPDASLMEKQFLLGQDRKQVWSKSIEEYRIRYQHFNAEQFGKQEKFLQALLKVARQRRIEVLLVNMPLTADNLKLMPPGFYRRYLDSLNRLTAGCKLLDLQKDPCYTNASFYDTVHLNYLGGQRFVGTLSEWIAGSSMNGRSAASPVQARSGQPSPEIK